MADLMPRKRLCRQQVRKEIQGATNREPRGIHHGAVTKGLNKGPSRTRYAQ